MAVELAGMKIDAPYQLERTLDDRLQLLDYVLEDLGLAQAHGQLVKAFSNPVRRRPTWSELSSCGGALGLTSVARGVADADVLLLLGHDPVGWLGPDFMAAQWLLEGVDFGDFMKEGSGPMGDGKSFLPPGTAMGMAAGGGLAAALTAAAVGTGVVMPVLAPLLAGAVAGAVTSSRSRRTLDPGKPQDSPSRHFPSAPVRVALMCLAFGWAWTRIETTKTLALYAAFGDEDWLPPATTLADHFIEQADQLRMMAQRERELSGTSDLDRNAPLRTMVDSADSLRAVAGQYDSR